MALAPCQIVILTLYSVASLWMLLLTTVHYSQNWNCILPTPPPPPPTPPRSIDLLDWMEFFKPGHPHELLRNMNTSSRLILSEDEQSQMKNLLHRTHNIAKVGVLHGSMARGVCDAALFSDLLLSITVACSAAALGHSSLISFVMFFPPLPPFPTSDCHWLRCASDAGCWADLLPACHQPHCRLWTHARIQPLLSSNLQHHPVLSEGVSNYKWVDGMILYLGRHFVLSTLHKKETEVLQYILTYCTKQHPLNRALLSSRVWSSPPTSCS